MIKSTKVERMVIEARLRDALKTTSNSDIKATLDALTDMDNIEVIFLKLHAMYEAGYIDEYYEKSHMHPGNKPRDWERDFFLAFNDMAELFSNHHDVQRARRDTNDKIHQMSRGAATVIRGKGIVTAQSPSPYGSKIQSGGTQAIPGVTTPYPTNQGIQAPQQPKPTATQLLMQQAQQQLNPPNQGLPVFKECMYCKTALTKSDKRDDICNKCLAKRQVLSGLTQCHTCGVNFSATFSKSNTVCDACYIAAQKGSGLSVCPDCDSFHKKSPLAAKEQLDQCDFCFEADVKKQGRKVSKCSACDTRFVQRSDGKETMCEDCDDIFKVKRRMLADSI